MTSRNPSKEEVDELVKRYRPPGWTLKYKAKGKDIWTQCYAKKEIKEILCPNPYHGRNELFVFIHECGHYWLRHWDRGLNHYHVEEYEAERWAIETLRRHGIAVPRRGLHEAKKYVRWCISQDEKKGIEIKSHVRRWAKGK